MASCRKSGQLSRISRSLAECRQADQVNSAASFSDSKLDVDQQVLGSGTPPVQENGVRIVMDVVLSDYRHCLEYDFVALRCCWPALVMSNDRDTGLDGVR
jgi:hypothetical protein